MRLLAQQVPLAQLDRQAPKGRRAYKATPEPQALRVPPAHRGRKAQLGPLVLLAHKGHKAMRFCILISRSRS